MRKILRDCFLATVGRFKNISKSVHVLNGHFVSEQDLNKEVFHDQIKRLQNLGTLKSIEGSVEEIVNNKLPSAPAISFTFDDGYEECYTKIAPTLRVFNVNAAFFICPGFINTSDDNFSQFIKSHNLFPKKAMSWKMVKELADQGFVIGSYTYDHVNLVNCSEKELIHQIVDSKKIIEDRIGYPCEYFAWPFGIYNDISEKALDIARKNYSYVFSACDYKQYKSSQGTVINRRHFEGDWPMSHLQYFLSFKKNY